MGISFQKIILIICSLSIGITTFINYQIANDYKNCDGKTQALFGLKENTQFLYQYYVAVLPLIALGVIYFNWRKSHHINIDLVHLNIIAICYVFSKSWRIWVNLI